MQTTHHLIPAVGQTIPLPNKDPSEFTFTSQGSTALTIRFVDDVWQVRENVPNERARRGFVVWLDRVPTAGSVIQITQINKRGTSAYAKVL